MMGETVSTVITFIALLVAISASYNAYLLRGGKLVWSQVLMVFGMISLIFSQILATLVSDIGIFTGLTAGDLFFILGFVLLLLASFKLRSSLR